MADITIYGPTSMLTGEYPLTEVRLATSWLVEGHTYTTPYRKGIWDGRKNLFNSKTGAFPTGLLKTVCGVLDEHKIEYTVTDKRQDPGAVRTLPTLDDPECAEAFTPSGVSFTGKYAYQLSAARTMVEKKQGLVRVATNGGKTEISCAVVKYLNLKTLFIVTSRELLYQAQKRFSTRLGVPLDEIGLIGDGHWEPGDWVTIATLDTLESRLDTEQCQRFLKTIEVLFVDEVHHAGSETWYEVATTCPAYYRYGLSGTPLDRTDGANLRIIAATGDIIVDIGNKFLVDAGVSARANIIFDKITEPRIPARTKYNEVYKQGVVENDQLNAKVIEWTKVCHNAGLSVLVLVEEIQHGKALDEMMWTKTGGKFIPHQFIWGDESTEIRAAALQEFSNRTLPVLISSTILDEGVDVPTIDVIILAGSRKSKIRTLQRLGRGLRGEKLIVIEFSNFCNDYLLKHSLVRFRDYKEEGCFPMHNSGPSEDLVRGLWNGNPSHGSV